MKYDGAINKMRFSCSATYLYTRPTRPTPPVYSVFTVFTPPDCIYIRAKPRRRPCDEGIFNSADPPFRHCTRYIAWRTRSSYSGSQRQISTVNTTGSVPTVFFPETRYRVGLIRPAALLFRPRLMIFSHYSRSKRVANLVTLYFPIDRFNIFRFDDDTTISTERVPSTIKKVTIYRFQKRVD